MLITRTFFLLSISSLLSLAGSAHANTHSTALAKGTKSLPSALRPRYRDNYRYLADQQATSTLDKLHYIALSPGSYLSMGAGLYSRFESNKNSVFGLTSTPEYLNYYQTDVEVDADLHLFKNKLRAFFRLDNTRSYSKPRLGPFDQSDTELHAAFIDWQGHPTPATALRLRLGRQELNFGSGVLFSTTASLNVRRAFDGMRVSWSNLDGYKLDIFTAEEVKTQLGNFNDSSRDSHNFYGSYATLPWDGKNFSQDIYVLREPVSYSPANGMSGEGERFTVGTRLYRKQAPLHYSVDLAYQAGHIGGKQVSAWATSSNFAYQFGAKQRYSIGLRGDIASGGSNTETRVKTFDPVFSAAGKLYSDGSYTYWSNIIAVGPKLAFKPTAKSRVSSTLLGIWKQDKDDFVYKAGEFVVPGSNHMSSRYVGSTIIVKYKWKAAKYLTLWGAYQYYKTGNAIHALGGHDSQWFRLVAALQF